MVMAGQPISGIGAWLIFTLCCAGSTALTVPVRVGVVVTLVRHLHLPDLRRGCSVVFGRYRVRGDGARAAKVDAQRHRSLLLC